MQPAGRLDPQAWMATPVLTALAARGATARFVGGCVRDGVLGRPVGDVDIATDASPADNIARLEEAGIRVVPTGLRHGTVTAVTEARSYEITTLRADIETDGRHARVAFIDNWEADALRRDLTMNALYCDGDGTLYDPVGGLADARAGRVRFIGDPDRRLREDYLRLHRYFRFLAWYGRVPPESDDLAACRKNAQGTAGLSGERLRAEMLKLLAADAPMRALGLMLECGVLRQTLWAPPDLDRCARTVAACADPVVRLGALTSDPEASAARLKLSAREALRLRQMHTADPDLDAVDSLAAARAAAQRLGVERAADRLAFLGNGTLAAALAGWQVPDLPVAGRDVLAAGLAPGPRVGELLRAVEAWWREQAFEPDREACLARLREEMERTDG